MQQSGDSVSQIAQRQSASALAARILARSRGLPMPFAAQRPVQNSESGQGWTMLNDYAFTTNGNMLVCVGAPVGGALGVVLLICRYLHR
mmetsp:Transcript_131472/g.319492  ORF Transcript_131472/g.319492 Transcript_131472/m.319492 type:complete len:89 (-) Transcript_131472:92-358(-)